MKNQTRPPLQQRLRWLDGFERYPLRYFKNDSAAWHELEKFFKANGAWLHMSLDNGLFVAGGSVVRAVMENDKTSDIDLWACGPQLISEAEQYFARIASMPGSNITVQTNNKYAPTYTGVSGQDIQICSMPENFNVLDTLASFDLFNSMFATDGRDIIMHTLGRAGVIENRIIVNTETDRPFGDNLPSRIEKYQKMGFRPPEGN